MRRIAALAAFLVLVPVASTAFAKAPRAAELPTVEEIFQQAKKQIDDLAKRAIDQAKDPLREAIEGYRDRKTPLKEFQALVDCINNAKDDNVQPYRADAAQALVTRFTREEENDPAIRQIRRAIARSVLDLMKAPQKDETGLRAIETILFAWWRATMQIEIKFKATDKLDARKKAYAAMKKYLDKDEKDRP